jgi:hypothetical protein
MVAYTQDLAGTIPLKQKTTVSPVVSIFYYAFSALRLIALSHNTRMKALPGAMIRQ